MNKSLLIEKRKKARELKKRGWSNQKIARYLIAHRDSVKKWLEMREDEVMIDSRGWRKGKLKKYSLEERKRIIDIHKELEREDGEPGTAGIIKLRYNKKYGIEIPRWLVYQTIREYKRDTCLPEGNPFKECVSDFQLKLFKNRARVIMNLDFLGTRSLKSKSDQTLFLSCKYVHPYEIGIISWVERQSLDDVSRVLKYIWHKFKRPDLVKMNYHSVFGAAPSQPGCIGMLTLYFLNLGIIPFYSPLPEGVGDIDLGGKNKVFSEIFCRKLDFTHADATALKIDNFHLEYRQKKDVGSRKIKIEEPPFGSVFNGIDLENRKVDHFVQDKILFNVEVKRKRGQKGKEGCAFIRVLATEIDLNKQWLGFWLLCKLNISRKKLYIFYKNEAGRLALLKKVDFWIKNVKYS